MALELVLTLTAYANECKDQIYKDETVYGGAELERNQVAVIVEAQKTQLTDEDDIILPISGNTADPLTDTEWTVTSENDGHHTLPMYVIPVYNAATSYSVGQCVYYTSAIWICIQAATGIAPGSDPAYWTQKTLTENRDEIEAADNVQYEYFQYITTCRLETCYSKVTSKEAQEGCCEGCNAAELKQTAERLDLLLNGISSLCGQLRYAEAEEVVRNMTHICEKSKCICD